MTTKITPPAAAGDAATLANELRTAESDVTKLEAAKTDAADLADFADLDRRLAVARTRVEYLRSRLQRAERDSQQSEWASALTRLRAHLEACDLETYRRIIGPDVQKVVEARRALFEAVQALKRSAEAAARERDAAAQLGNELRMPSTLPGGDFAGRAAAEVLVQAHRASVGSEPVPEGFDWATWLLVPRELGELRSRVAELIGTASTYLTYDGRLSLEQQLDLLLAGRLSERIREINQEDAQRLEDAQAVRRKRVQDRFDAEVQSALRALSSRYNTRGDCVDFASEPTRLRQVRRDVMRAFKIDPNDLTPEQRS